MARRIFLHIGVMKSATSYLQALCEENQQQLTAAGLYWCPEDLRYRAVRDALGRTRGALSQRSGWDQVREALLSHPGDALLSNELLAGLGQPQIRRLVGALPAAELRVVITARDLARIIPSHWQTTVRNGRTWTWLDFAAAVCHEGPSEGSADREGSADPEGSEGRDGSPEANRWFWKRHDLPAIVARWAEVVPVGHITLVTVPVAPGVPGDSDTLASRFGSVIGVDLDGLDHPVTRNNPTLGAHSVELLRRLNSALGQVELDDPEHRYERVLGEALAEYAHREPKFGLTQGQQRWVRQRARAMLEELRPWGVNVVGDLADLLPEESLMPGSVDPGDTSDVELLEAAARGLVALAPAFNDLRTERNDLRQSLGETRLKRGT